MEVNNQLKVKVNVKLYEFPNWWNYDNYLEIKKNRPELLKIYLRDEGHNLVVDVGLFRLRDMIIDVSDVGFTHCSVGSGTNTPAAGDTDLQTPIGRNTVTNRYQSVYDAKFDTFFASADQNGTWNETGIHDAASAGTMFCRRKFGSSFVKSTANTALVAWTITFAAVADV